MHAAIARIMSARSFYIALYDAPANGIRFAYRVDERDEVPDPEKLFPLQPSHLSPTAKVIRKAMRHEPTIDWLLENQIKVEHYYHKLGLDGEL